MPAAALCPLREMATAVGDEEIARDMLELEEEQEKRHLGTDWKLTSAL